jgi:PIN domain nuclease of toxin-antitoxin system
VSEAVLDASALIAYLRSEPGGQAIAMILPNSVISTVNLTEVVTRMIDEGLSPAQANEIVTETSVATASFDEHQAIAAGALRATTRSLGLSLGDRACLGLAQHLDVPALTADRRWADLDIGVEVRLIRD